MRSSRSLIAASVLILIVAGTVILWVYERAPYRDCPESMHDDRKVAEAKSQGDRIVTAIIDYHSAEGEFPFRLRDLVPDYLAEIPRPAAGVHKWYYMRVTAEDGRSTFTFGFSCHEISTLYPGYYVVVSNDNVLDRRWRSRL